LKFINHFKPFFGFKSPSSHSSSTTAAGVRELGLDDRVLSDPELQRDPCGRAAD
jgi:hypothetical protein